jgi:hypothetical protein
MAWLELHQSLPTHRKTLMMADALDVTPVQIVGHLTCLWLWALDNAQDGVLHVSPQMIARAAQWEDEAQPFTEALLAAGFLEPDGHIHDWDAYAGRLIEGRRKSAERAKAWREQHGTRNVPSISNAANAHGTRSERIANEATVPNRTVPNQPSAPNGAGPALHAVPKPTKPKPKPAREQLPTHPAVRVLRLTLGFAPDERQRETISQSVGSDDEALRLWEQCCTAWKDAGYNSRNLAGVLDWFQAGGPPPRERSPNGAAQRNGALSTGKPPSQFSRNLQTINQFWSDHAPDPDRTENDLRTVHRELPGELSR